MKKSIEPINPSDYTQEEWLLHCIYSKPEWFKELKPVEIVDKNRIQLMDNPARDGDIKINLMLRRL